MKELFLYSGSAREQPYSPHHPPLCWFCALAPVFTQAAGEKLFSRTGTLATHVMPIQKHCIHFSKISVMCPLYLFVIIFTFFLCFSYHCFILPSMFFLFCWWFGWEVAENLYRMRISLKTRSKILQTCLSLICLLNIFGSKNKHSKEMRIQYRLKLSTT